MNWIVRYSLQAKKDLHSIYRYIADILLAPAAGQTLRIIEAINSLSAMPMRYRLYDHEPWRKLGLRIMPVDNYVVLYLPKEDSGLVQIVRIVYGKRDLPSQLDEIDLPSLMEE